MMDRIILGMGCHSNYGSLPRRRRGDIYIASIHKIEKLVAHMPTALGYAHVRSKFLLGNAEMRRSAPCSSQSLHFYLDIELILSMLIMIHLESAFWHICQRSGKHSLCYFSTSLRANPVRADHDSS